MEKRAPGRPTDRQSADLEMIKRSVIKEFARQGYGGVSLNALGRKVGVADSLLHYHFGSKLDLWKSCLELVGSEITETFANLQRLSSDLNGVERIKLYNKQLVYISAEFPEFQQIVVQEVFSESERSEWLITELLRPIYRFFEEILQEEQDKGTIKCIPSANLTSFIIGSITTLFSRSYQMKKLYGVDAFSADEVERHADIMNDLILEALIVRD
ncbi:TetR/AcrR family transcriptional regulator [Portibacter marinus]|uniref:TetR/AcrR family transcriptional regulator n=1 Tax=Portibacter marinus TaxID=2898660 RepID=UPI001F18BDA3|nr:TetR/AcrR family transcriptional regulator [Portibacter marinus]